MFLLMNNDNIFTSDQIRIGCNKMYSVKRTTMYAMSKCRSINRSTRTCSWCMNAPPCNTSVCERVCYLPHVVSKCIKFNFPVFYYCYPCVKCWLRFVRLDLFRTCPKLLLVTKYSTTRSRTSWATNGSKHVSEINRPPKPEVEPRPLTFKDSKLFNRWPSEVHYSVPLRHSLHHVARRFSFCILSPNRPLLWRFTLCSHVEVILTFKYSLTILMFCVCLSAFLSVRFPERNESIRLPRKVSSGQSVWVSSWCAIAEGGHVWARAIAFFKCLYGVLIKNQVKMSSLAFVHKNAARLMVTICRDGSVYLNYVNNWCWRNHTHTHTHWAWDPH